MDHPAGRHDCRPETPPVGRHAPCGRSGGRYGRQASPGAEVSQSGDGPKKTQGTTDREGRFRVTGVPNTPAFLFVTKEGYHFLGRRVDPKDRSIEFTLRRLDEPPAAPLRLMRRRGLSRRGAPIAANPHR